MNNNLNRTRTRTRTRTRSQTKNNNEDKNPINSSTLYSFADPIISNEIHKNLRSIDIIGSAKITSETGRVKAGHRKAGGGKGDGKRDGNAESVIFRDDDSSDDESIDTPNQKEKNNKIIVGIAVKPTEKINSKKYLMNDFDLFTVYNSLPYSTVDNVDDFLKNFFKFIQTKRDDNGKILSYDNYEDVTKKDITYFVIDPSKYSNENENGKNKDSNSGDGDEETYVKNVVLSGGKKTRKTSKKSRKTKKSQKNRKQN